MIVFMIATRDSLEVENDRNVSPRAPSRDTAASRWKRWRGLSLEAQFEHIVLFLSGLIAWSLS
jgi:hypothetical protein